MKILCAVLPLVVPFSNPHFFLHQSICIVLGTFFSKAKVFTSCPTWHCCLSKPETGPKAPVYGRCGQGLSWASSVCVVGRWQLWCLWSCCYEWNDDKIPKKAENCALFDAAVDDMFIWNHMDISLKNISWLHMTRVFAVSCEEISAEPGWTSHDPIILMGFSHLPNRGFATLWITFKAARLRRVLFWWCQRHLNKILKFW